MIVGMTASAFTFVQVALSLVGIGSGFVVMYGLLTRKQVNGWTALFLAITVTTSVTRFGFPFERLLPPLNAIAPKQSEPPFLLTQLLVLSIFIALAIVAAIRFRTESVQTA
jgi:hypothetical protein